MKEIYAVFVPGDGSQPCVSTLRGDDTYAALRDYLGGEIMRLWPFSDPCVVIVCRKNAELDMSKPRRGCVNNGHGRVIANIFGDFFVLELDGDKNPVSMSRENADTYQDRFRGGCDNCGFGDDCSRLREYAEDFVIDSDQLSAAGLTAEYHADTRSLLLRYRDEEAALDHMSYRERRNRLWENAVWTWSALNPNRYTTPAQITYSDDNLFCTVGSANMYHRLQGCYALRKSLAHVRNPEKHTRIPT